MDVSHLEAGAITGQTAWTKRGDTALVGQLSQRVLLVHELRQLRTGEELLDRRGQRTDVRQLLRRQRRCLCDGHTLLDHALHAAQTDAELVLDQLADRADAAVAQHIDVVGLADPIHDVQIVGIERIHIGDSNGVLIRKRVIADDLHHIAVCAAYIQLLHGSADQPCVHFISGIDIRDDLFHRIWIQRIRLYARRIAVDIQIAVCICDIISLFVSQTRQRVHALSVVQPRCRIFCGHLHLFGDDPAMHADLFHVALEHVDVSFAQHAAFIQRDVIQFDVGSQDTADQPALPFHRHFDHIRVVEQRIERECRHIDALVQLFAQRVALIAADIRSALHEDRAVCADDILRQRRMICTRKRIQLLSQLEPSGLGQVITARIEELGVHQGDGSIQRRDLVAALVLIDGQQRLLRRLDLIGEQGVLQFLIFSEERGI